MPRLQSVQSLQKLRETAQKKIEARSQTGTTITVGMGSCGIAAGARETLRAIQEELERRGLAADVVTVGCVSLCASEPLVTVEQAGMPRITYGNVSPAMVPRLIEEHLVKGRVVGEWMAPEPGERLIDLTSVEEIVAEFKDQPAPVVDMLRRVQDLYGYVPREALELISKEMRIPVGRLYGLVTFYSLLSTKPRGQHVIRFCESAPCHIVGGREVWEALRRELQIEPGETSRDGRFTLELTSCLGLCSVGPVIVVDGDVYGNLTPESVPEILSRYR
jgi:NADH-quinone oxidoreductase subunit E